MDFIEKMDYLTNGVRTNRYTSMGKVFTDFSLISYVKNKFQVKFISKEHKIIIAVKRTLNILLKIGIGRYFLNITQ